MSQKKVRKRKLNKAYLAFYLYMLLVLMSLFSVASYTWFSLSQTPRVSDMNMYITTQAGLELAATPQGEWVQQLDFREIVNETTPLRPVTWSEENQRFYAAAYGLDGRMMPYENWHALSDERNANRTNMDGYYIKTTFYARTGQNVNVTFAPAVELNEGEDCAGTYLKGTPVWNIREIRHDNAGKGAENAVRLGFRFLLIDEDGNPYVDPNTGEEAQPEDFLIYEPNSDLHYDSSRQYVSTPSIDGTSDLVNIDRIIRQTATTWTDKDPVVRNEVVHDVGDFLDTRSLFYLKTGQIMKIDLYIWLEGQDIDCLNAIQRAQLEANIQFTGDTESQSGLTTIPVTP